MSAMTQTGFDYAALPVDAAMNARAAAERIKLRLKRTVEDIIEIGRELTAVKAELPHGQFEIWIKDEFQMNREMANNFMQVATRFGGQMSDYLTFKPTILYALAAPSTPESVVDQAVAKAESGKKVTVANVKDWKAELEVERQRREAAEKVLLEEQQRCREFGAESNDRRKKIRELEEQIDLLGNQAKPEPVIVEKEVIPADYESIKDKVTKAERALEKLQRDQSRLVKEQVAAKLQGYQSEVDEMERKKAVMQEQVDRMKTYMESLDSEAQRLEVHQDVIEKSRLELISLAAFLNDLDPIEDKGTIKKWLALAGMHQAAADSIGLAFGNHRFELSAAA